MTIDNEEETLAAVIGEMQDRVNQGEALDLEKYLEMHPKWAAEISEFSRCGDLLDEALLPATPRACSPGDGEEGRLDLEVFPIRERLTDLPLGTRYLLAAAPGQSARELVVLRAWLKPSQRVVVERHANHVRGCDVPGTLRVLDIGRLGQLPFIVREHADGTTLEALWRGCLEFEGTYDLVDTYRRLTIEGDLTHGSAAGQPNTAIADRLLRGPRHLGALCASFVRWARILDSMHVKGMLHGEITPAHLVVGRDGLPAIQGIGLCTFGTGVDSRRIKPSPATWLAPEVFSRGSRPVNWGADTYGLGMAFMAALSLGEPTRRAEVTGSSAGSGTEAVDADGVAIPVLPSATPARLAELLHRAVDPDPSRRPPSCAAFAQGVLSAVPDAARWVDQPLDRLPRLTISDILSRSKWRWIVGLAALVVAAIIAFAFAKGWF